MPRDRENRRKQQNTRLNIAATAARIMAEDGIEDFSLAKRKAARQLGGLSSYMLPDNAEIEEALRTYQSLYQGDEQRERIAYLRRCAIDAMQTLTAFRPYLCGSVLSGTAGRYSDIDLQLFTEDSKSVELYLLNRNFQYEVGSVSYFVGDREGSATMLTLDWQDVTLNLIVHPAVNERVTLKSGIAGRPIARAGIAAVRLLLTGDAQSGEAVHITGSK